MVIKVLTRKNNVQQLVKYILHNKDEKEKEKSNSIILKKNLHGSKERWAKQIEFNNTLRKTKNKNMTGCYHTIISLHPKDCQLVSKKILKDLAQKFIELRGCDAQHLVTYHSDREHSHLHCVTGGTKLMTGVANRQSKQEFKQMKIELEKYQMKKYPELQHSIVQTKEKIDRVTKIKNTRTSMKEQLNNELADLYAQSKNMNSFYTSIQEKGYSLYERNGKITGLIDKELKYRFSKLGFDKDKLNYLDSPEHHMDIQMQELDDMRNSSRVVERCTKNQNRELDDKEEQENEIQEEEMEIEDDNYLQQ